MRKKRFESLESQRVPRLEGGAPPPSFLGRAFGFRRRLEIEGEGKSPPPLPSKPKPRSEVTLEEPSGPSERAVELRRDEARRKLAQVHEQEQIERKAEIAETEITRRYLRRQIAGLVFSTVFLSFGAVVQIRRYWLRHHYVPIDLIVVSVLLIIYFVIAGISRIRSDL